MRDVERSIRAGLVSALEDADDARVIVVDSDEQNEKVSEEHRVENALFVSAFVGGFGHSVWIPKHLAGSAAALEAVGQDLADEIRAYRSAGLQGDDA